MKFTASNSHESNAPFSANGLRQTPFQTFPFTSVPKQASAPESMNGFSWTSPMSLKRSPAGRSSARLPVEAVELPNEDANMTSVPPAACPLHRVPNAKFARWRRRWSLLGCLTAATVWMTSSSAQAQDQVPPGPESSNAAFTLPMEDASGSASYGGNYGGSGSAGNYGGGWGTNPLFPTYPEEPPVVGGFGTKARFTGQAGKTVGQSQPIQSFDLSPYIFHENLYLFGEGRIALGNDGKTGGSLGAGARYFMPRLNSIVGASGWLDIDATRGPTFRQWSIGAEFLSEFFDIRGNIYTPYGETSKITAQRFEAGSQFFTDRPIADIGPGEEQGTYLSFQRRIFTATALQGFDTLFTVPMPGEFARKLNLETSAGFYGYEAKDGSIDQTFGWRLRFDVDLFQRFSHMFLEINDDKAFKTNVAFGADINFWHKLEHRPRIGHSQYNRLAEWVRRNRTVVALEGSFLSAPETAINPLTGNPYVFYQVNTNNPGGNSGTLGDPFQSLQDALSFVGDSSSDFVMFVQGNSVITENITLVAGVHDGVRIIGEQTNPSIGIPVQGLSDSVLLPTLTPVPFNTPVIDGVVGDALTINANNTFFGGINITNVTGGDAIVVNTGVSGGSFQDVAIETVTGGNGVNLQGVTGTFNFNNVTITDIEENAFNVVGGNANIQFSGGSAIDNTTNSHPSHGFAVNIEDTTGGNINLQNLAVADTGGRGIRVIGTAPGDSRANVSFGAVTLTDTVVDTDTGAVYIANHSGSVSFTGALAINGIDAIAEGDAFVVRNLQATGSVFAGDTVTITNRRGRGIYVVDSADSGSMSGNAPNNVNFNGTVSINGQGTGYTGSDSAVLFESNSGGLIFGGTLNINGSRGHGIEVTGGSGPEGTDVALFQVASANITGVNGVGGPPGTTGTSFYVHDITKSAFRVIGSNIQIANRGTAASNGLRGVGMHFSDFAGTAVFANGVTIANEQGSFANAIEIFDNSGAISFSGQVNITNQLGLDGSDFGVLVFNNSNDVSGISFATLNVESDTATAVSLGDNALVTIGSGTLNATDARAIEVFSTVPALLTQRHAITLNSVSATGADAGIVVVDSDGRFTVTGTNQVAGSGGTITGMTVAGAYFENTQLVDLNYMNLSGNLRGITAIDLLPPTTGNHGLYLGNMQITGSGNEGIYAEDVATFELRNSLIVANGQAGTEEQIELFATTATFNGEDVAYNYLFDNNTITDGTTAISATDMIYIHTSASLPTSVPLTLTFTNNGSPVAGSNPNSVTSNRSGGSALLDVTWRGTMDANIVNNQFFLLNGANQVGLDFTVTGSSNLNYVNNGLSATGAGATGIRGNFASASTVTISGNQVFDDNDNLISGTGFLFDGVNSTGLDLTLSASGNRVDINNNLMEFNDFGSRAIVFQRIAGSSGNTVVGIGGNTIARVVNTNDALIEQGVLFQIVQGTITLNSAQGNNLIYSNGILLDNNPGFFNNFVMPAGASGGSQVLINNIFYP